MCSRKKPREPLAEKTRPIDSSRRTCFVLWAKGSAVSVRSSGGFVKHGGVGRWCSEGFPYKRQSPARTPGNTPRRFMWLSRASLDQECIPVSRQRIPDKRGYGRTGRLRTACRQRCERRIRCQCTRPCRGRTFFQASPQSNKKAAVTPAKKSAAKARVRALNAVLVAGVNVSQCPKWQGSCQAAPSQPGPYSVRTTLPSFWRLGRSSKYNHFRFQSPDSVPGLRAGRQRISISQLNCDESSCRRID